MQHFFGPVIDMGSASALAAKDDKRPTCSMATKPEPDLKETLQSERVLRLRQPESDKKRVSEQSGTNRKNVGEAYYLLFRCKCLRGTDVE